LREKSISAVCTEFLHVLSNTDMNDSYHIMKSTSWHLDLGTPPFV